MDFGNYDWLMGNLVRMYYVVESWFKEKTKWFWPEEIDRGEAALWVMRETIAKESTEK